MDNFLTTFLENVPLPWDPVIEQSEADSLEAQRYVMQFKSKDEEILRLYHEIEHDIENMKSKADRLSISRKIDKLDTLIRRLKLDLLRVPTRLRSDVVARLPSLSIVSTSELKKRLGEKMAELNIPISPTTKYYFVPSLNQRKEEQIKEKVEQLRQEYEQKITGGDGSGGTNMMDFLTKYGVWLVAGVGAILIIILILKKRK